MSLDFLISSLATSLAFKDAFLLASLSLMITFSRSEIFSSLSTRPFSAEEIFLVAESRFSLTNASSFALTNIQIMAVTNRIEKTIGTRTNFFSLELGSFG